MTRFSGVLCITLLAFACASEVTPVEKVISLIEGLKKEVETDGKTEATAYSKFACFCKATTDKKSSSVIKGTEQIGLLSADIADKTQEQKDDNTELTGRKQAHENLNRELDETIARCAKQKAEYEAQAADLSKAIQGLKDAIKAMKGSKPSLLAIRQAVGKTFQMAEAMNLLSTPKHKVVASFLQQANSVDPNDPEFKFHSNDIIDVCEKLLVDYKGSKKELDEEWAKTKTGCTEMKASLKKKLSANKSAMDALVKSIAKLKKEIAGHRGALVESNDLLKDDELYLKDMTARCQDRANDYDQRSAMRGDELAALTQALKVLTGTVKKTASEVNKRALLFQQAVATKSVPTPVKKSVPVAGTASAEAAKTTLKKVSLLQGSSSSDLSLEARKEKVVKVLLAEGQLIGSLALTSLAERIAAPRFDSTPATDPFKKIKGLIQKLIERLLEESKNEATKKGFCDAELGKARKDRDFRFQESNDLSADLSGLEAERDALTLEIKQLTGDIKSETKTLKETTEERKEEKEVNMKTLSTAKEGLEAVNEAILILRSFYKQAAKASLLQASPVDEDTQGAGFSGNYKGKQSGMKAVFALLETIASDFDRTLRKTEEAEHTAHRDFVEFSQAAESSIAGKTTKKDLDEQDLKTTKMSIKQKTEDLQTAVDLLDSALKELEQLKPTCIDTGMSFSERVKKRKEEMAALQKALCILDENKVEKECQP